MDAASLIAKYAEVGDKSRYAIHRAAESEAWKAWYRSGPDAERRDPGAAYVAISIAERYHNNQPVAA